MADVPEDQDWKTKLDRLTKTYVEPATRGAAQGLSLGFGDELSGAGAVKDALIGHKSDPTQTPLSVKEYLSNLGRLPEIYANSRDLERKANSDAELTSPAIYGASELAGGLAVPVPGGSEVAGAKSLGRLAKLARGAETGAKIGAAAGYGHSENPNPLSTDTALGGTLGGLLGAGAGALKSLISPSTPAPAIENLPSRFQERFRDAGLEASARKFALEQVGDGTLAKVMRRVHEVPGVAVSAGKNADEVLGASPLEKLIRGKSEPQINRLLDEKAAESEIARINAVDRAKGDDSMGVWSPERYAELRAAAQGSTPDFNIVHSTDDNGNLIVKALKEDGRLAAYSEFKPTKDGLAPNLVFSYPEHSRRGLAEKLYKKANEITGQKILQGDVQLDDGKAFRSSPKLNEISIKNTPQTVKDYLAELKRPPSSTTAQNMPSKEDWYKILDGQDPDNTSSNSTNNIPPADEKVSLPALKQLPSELVLRSVSNVGDLEDDK